MTKQQNKEPYLLRRYRIVFWVLMVAGVAYVVYHWTDRRRTERIPRHRCLYYTDALLIKQQRGHKASLLLSYLLIS